MAAKKSNRAQLKSSWLKTWFWRLFFFATVIGLGFCFYLDQKVRVKFDGKKWALPAKVYARPLELYAGLNLAPNDLAYELKQLGYRFGSHLKQPGDVVNLGQQWQIYNRGFEYWDGDEPARQLKIGFDGKTLSRLSDAKGRDLDLVRIEPLEIAGIYPEHMEDRELVRLIDVPRILGEALIVVEDRNFAHHYGVSLKGIARALITNIRAGAPVQGGSTLTQQLVKNFYLNHERSLKRKALEAIMSVLLELRYSKAEILETYINEIYLGQSGKRGVHGFALAARHYFGQPLNELKTEQIALLVGLVKGASYYNPWRNPERSKSRRDLVLKMMWQHQLIEQLEYKQAIAKPLGIVKKQSRSINRYPGFLDLVKRQLKQDYREQDLRSEGLRIFTSLSPIVQHHGEAAIAKRLAYLERYYGLKKQPLQAAMVVTAVGSGEILALVGDRRSDYSGFNRALDAKRPVGSLFKPAIVLTALQQPERYSLAGKVSDAPVALVTPEGGKWQPQNFDRKSHGEVMLYRGLAKSYNQQAARLGSQLGLDAVFQTLYGLGVKQPLPALPSVLLGAAELSPLRVATVYHTIANEGTYTPLRGIRAVSSASGVALNRYPLKIKQEFAPGPVHLTQFAMQAAMRIGTGRSAYKSLPAALAVAGKTGTTNDQRDSWFAGFSGDHLGVVWIGRDDNGKTPLTGASGALRVWTDLFAKLNTRSIIGEPPADVEYLWVDQDSGRLSHGNCQGAIELPFIKGYGPQQKADCNWQQAPAKGKKKSWWQRIFG